MFGTTGIFFVFGTTGIFFNECYFVVSCTNAQIFLFPFPCEKRFCSFGQKYWIYIFFFFRTAVRRNLTQKKKNFFFP